MNDPLISVIVPAYNHERFIEETIRSIIAQTYQNIELLIIDDGSTDDTWQKLQELKPECEKRFTRVIFEHQENSGTCVSLNHMISMAKGDFSFFIDSDDVAKPQAVERLANFMNLHDDYVLAVGDNDFIDADSKIVGWDKYGKTVTLDKAKHKTFGEFLQHSRKDVDFRTNDFGSYSTLVRGNYIPNGYLVKLKALRQTGGYTIGAPLEDWYMNMQLAKLGKMKYFDEVLYSYRQHGANTIHRKAYMQNITSTTRIYEQKIINRAGNEDFKKIFDEENFYCEVKFSLGNVIKIYKEVDVRYESKILEIFGKKIFLKKKARQ